MKRNQPLKTKIKRKKNWHTEKGEKPVTPLSSQKPKNQNHMLPPNQNPKLHSHAISDSLTQWPPIHQTNSTSTLLLLLSRSPDRLEEEEEEEEEEEPTDEASD
ncbi:hypothetical protein ACB092_11G040900 [Castanea dentata]